MIVGRPLYFSFIDYSVPGENYNAGDQEIRTRRHIRFFYPQAGDLTKAKRLSPLDPYSMLLKRSDVRPILDSIINNWFSNAEQYNNSCSSYISDLYLPGYIETSFLNVAKGLEAFHRFFYKSNKQNETDAAFESDRSNILEFIKNNVSENNQKEFIDRVNYQSETSFGGRIKDLIKKLPEELKPGYLIHPIRKP